MDKREKASKATAYSKFGRGQEKMRRGAGRIGIGIGVPPPLDHTIPSERRDGGHISCTFPFRVAFLLACLSMEFFSSHGRQFLLCRSITKNRIGPIKYTLVCIRTYLRTCVLKDENIGYVKARNKGTRFTKPYTRPPPSESPIAASVAVLSLAR